MASKVQKQLNFPVRKSSRQSKPSRVLQEADQTKSTVQKPSARHSKRESAAPQGRSSSARKKQPEECDSSPHHRESTPWRTASARRQHEVDTSTHKKDCTPQRSASAGRAVEANCPLRRDYTPVRASKARHPPPEALSSCQTQSPSKRKANSVESPPTPPKSPCKSGRSTVQKTPRCPSPEIYSEESDNEEESDQWRPRRLVRPHNGSADLMTFSKTALHVQTTAAVGSPLARKARTGVKNIDCDELCDKTASNGVEESSLDQGQQTARTVSEQYIDTPLPPPTPPMSPFVSASLSYRTATEESLAREVLHSTPTKATQCSHMLQSEGAHQPGSPLTSHHQGMGREVPSLFKTPTATPQKLQASEKILSPCKTGPSTPQSKKMLSQCKTRSSTPQKLLLSESKVLSPKKTAGSPRKSMASPQKKSASPRKTLMPGDEENFTLKSPKLLPKLQLAKPDNSGYQRVKQSLHTAKPEHLVGREEEVREISDFLRTHLEGRSAGSLYISGAPGTGKTAALLHIIDDFKAQYTCRIAYVNCMMVKDVSSVFRRLHSELSGKPASGRTSVRDMASLVTTSKMSMILVLDEIDQLDSKNQEVLYTIFEWPSLLHSKLILVGVANALDLTDRILPRLQAKPGCRPRLLHFAPYTRDQITAIIRDRLMQTGETIMESSAIQFCARKVAAVAGDMRKALDVCRRAVELAECETRCQTVLKASDHNSPRKHKAGPTVKRIGVGHVSQVLGEVYGSSVQAQQSEGVPLQQKLVVCSLLLLVQTGRGKEVPLGRLHETYCKVCRRQQMSPVDQSEFHSLCVLLEARGVVGLKKAKETRLMKVSLRQDEKELEQTLKDRVLVSAILADGLPK